MFLFLNMPIILSAERLEKVVCGVLCLIYVKNWRRKGSENGKERRKKEGYRERKRKSELAEVGRKKGGRTGGRKLDREEGKKEGGKEDGEEGRRMERREGGWRGGRAGRQEGIVTCSQGTGKLMAVHGVWQYSYGDEILGRHSMIPLQTPVLF